ncbi:MAG: phosphate acyltransferase PlsX [Dehalococcoidales bacterium]|jgi:glycerol-3-phosphate acyltransferase PlsX|nr:phosphate acyltransferase PlsX [Dehalococcoidales bacterium]
MIIAVDASGGDYAPHEIVKGAIKAARQFDVQIALVGKKEILYVLAGRHTHKLGIQIIDAPQTITYHESPVEGIRNKPESSIVIGTNLVKTGQADAFVSAGNTGAVLFSALLNLGKMEGIERPAVGSLLSLNATTPVVLIDAGANADCRPNHLVQFAHLGSDYIKAIFDIASPTVGLLNNGEEEKKGNRLTQETYQLLKETPLNFIGNVEGHDIVSGKANVIVTDGFTGNIVLKTLEGVTATWLDSLGQAGQVFSKAYSMPSRVIRNVGVDSWQKKLDFAEIGGSCLLGVNGTIIISHGRSRAKAIMNAIGLAKRTAERMNGQNSEESVNE